MNAFHALNVGLQADTFFEYVRSKANIADLPSRGARAELADILADRATFGALKRVTCRLPSLAEWNSHASAWITTGKERVARGQKRGRSSD